MSGGITPLLRYKLGLKASADVGRQKGGTTSDDRDLIGFHSPHTALCHLRILLAGPSCVIQMDGLFRQSLFVLIEKPHRSHIIRYLLCVCVSQNHQLRKLMALFLTCGCARKIYTRVHISKALPLLNPMITYVPCLNKSFLYATDLQLGYDAIN